MFAIVVKQMILVSYFQGFWLKVMDSEQVSKEKSDDRWWLSACFSLGMEGGNAQQELLPKPTSCSGLLNGDQPSGKG